MPKPKRCYNKMYLDNIYSVAMNIYNRKNESDWSIKLRKGAIKYNWRKQDGVIKV